jgi:hypothetical protein
MGTAHEWFLVLVVGFPFGGLRWLLNYPRPKFVQPPRIYWMLCVLDYALFGFWFGVLEAFRDWRPFRPPLVYLNVGILVCMLFVSYSHRRITRNLPRLPKKPALFPAPDFSRIEKKPDANDVT